MNFDRLSRQLALPLCFGLSCIASSGHAAPQAAPPTKVEMFGATTWAALQKSLPRPAAVVFTTTDCSNCPAVFKKLSEAAAGRKPAVPLVAVIMDAEPDEARAHSHYFQGISRLFIFDGQDNVLRYSVDPRWPGMTPYSALIPAKGKMQMVLGMPDSTQLGAWLQH